MQDAPAVDYWPSQVPDTLWNYSLLQRPPDFPLMGLSFTGPFLWAFAGGLGFVAVFAWRRFQEKTFDPKSFSYRVLKELSLTVLRGGSAMRRAYIIYAGTLIGLYIAMTFFGKLILQVVGNLPIVGPQVDVGGLNFDSPQWPLTLAFGFAGLAPLLPPLQVFETWLRGRAHKVVGIPTRIDQLARRLIDNYERFAQQQEAAAAQARAGGGEAPATRHAAGQFEWIATTLGSEAAARRADSIYDELAHFRDWSDSEDPEWPDRSVRIDLRQLEREVAMDASGVLQEYDDILGDVEVRGSGSATQSKRRRLRLRLEASVKRMTELRGDMAAIIAVYAEGDRKFALIRDEVLRKSLDETFSFMRVRSGPETGLAVALPIVFLVYAAACGLELHPLLNTTQITWRAVLLTASLETFRFAAVFTVPAVAAFAVRFYELDRTAGERHDPKAVPSLSRGQRTMNTLMGTGVAALMLGLVALAAAAILSSTATEFQLRLFRNEFLIYYTTQAAFSAVFLHFALKACDVVAPAGADRRRRRLGVACVVVLLAALLVYFHHFYQGRACGDDPFFPTMLFDQACFRNGTGMDYLIYPIAAFLACAVFGVLPEGAVAPEARGDAGAADAAVARPPVSAAAAIGGLVVLATLALLSRPAFSAECESGENPEPCTVTVGFRADAEPFSYRVTVDGSDQYHGYIADLCYALFAGSDYRIDPVEVAVGDRFDQLQHAVPSGPQVDMLCDPLTLRFTEEVEETDGIYSPIVFASGVTYMLRKGTLAGGHAYLRFARGSTAERIAEMACTVDLLGIRQAGQSPQDDECTAPKTTEPCPAKQPDVLVPDAPVPPRSSAPRRYHLCAMESHAALIEWFCRPGTVQGQMAYFGDREIIEGKLRAYVRQDGHRCAPDSAIEKSPSNYSYEPYAILVSARRPKLAQFVQRRVYQFFSQPANARWLFQKYFPHQQMSPALSYLYLLNGVADGEAFTYETLPDQPTAPAEDAGTSPALPATKTAPEAQPSVSFGTEASPLLPAVYPLAWPGRREP